MNIEPYIWWATAGLMLIILDLVVGSFFVLFLGAGALLTAIIALIGVENSSTQWLIFAISSILFASLLRKPLHSKFGPNSKPSYVEHIGQIIEIVADENDRGLAKASYRGTYWMVRSNSNKDLNIGDKLPIIAMDGITIVVE